MLSHHPSICTNLTMMTILGRTQAPKSPFIFPIARSAAAMVRNSASRARMPLRARLEAPWPCRPNFRSRPIHRRMQRNGMPSSKRPPAAAFPDQRPLAPWTAEMSAASCPDSRQLLFRRLQLRRYPRRRYTLKGRQPKPCQHKVYPGSRPRPRLNNSLPVIMRRLSRRALVSHRVLLVLLRLTRASQGSLLAAYQTRESRKPLGNTDRTCAMFTILHDIKNERRVVGALMDS